VCWTLDPDDRATSPTHTARCENYQSRLLECTQCGAVRVGGEPCSHCGYLPQRPPRAVAIAAGELGEVGRDRRVNPKDYTPHDRAFWHGQLAYIASERGYKPGWVSHKYKEKFGMWPPYGSHPALITPSPEVRSWVRSRAIAWAKGRAA
jgi:DNA repair protein RadD